MKINYFFSVKNIIKKIMGLLYWLCKKCAQAIISLYFRKIHVVGKDNVPKDGPIIICGNHANQFIDPLLIGSFVNKQLSFTIAQSSFSKPIIGYLAKAVKAIPVKRPEDSKRKGSGKISLVSPILIKGVNTKFVEEGNQIGKGWGIMILNFHVIIKKVIDNENLEILESSDIENLFVNESKTEYDFFVRLFKIIIKTTIL